MKVFRLFATVLMVALCSMVVSSCSDDDDDNGKASIIGKWNVTDVYYQGVWISAEDAGYESAYAQFNSDLSYRARTSADGSTRNGTYVYKDNVITCKVNTATVTYTIIELKGNNITAELSELGETTRFKATRQ